MNGFIIKSKSDEGIYYLVKEWRKNRKLWVKKENIKQDYLYKTMANAVNELEKLLNEMDDYASDEFVLLEFGNGEIVSEVELVIEDTSTSQWNSNYKVIIE